MFLCCCCSFTTHIVIHVLVGRCSFGFGFWSFCAIKVQGDANVKILQYTQESQFTTTRKAKKLYTKRTDHCKWIAAIARSQDTTRCLINSRFCVCEIGRNFFFYSGLMSTIFFLVQLSESGIFHSHDHRWLLSILTDLFVGTFNLWQINTIQ